MPILWATIVFSAIPAIRRNNRGDATGALALVSDGLQNGFAEFRPMDFEERKILQP